MTNGISHHNFRAQKNRNSSPDPCSAAGARSVRLSMFSESFLEDDRVAEDERIHAAALNVLSASAGVLTMGSPRRLKLVFSSTGTPVAWPNSVISR